VLTNDPHPPSEETVGVTIDDFAVIATKVVILPGVKVGKDALVGAMSLVNSDVPPEAIVVGSPAKAVGNVRKIRSKTTGENVYPWREHFDRGMPWEGIGYEHWRDKQPGEIRRNEP
jgi:carbonic anhydrase/acetyltransferase-like protein (isoleucine patch superfamily)